MSARFSKSNYDAVVVGSGPNGLACAVELARNGLSVLIVEKSQTPGGGTKTLEITEPGFLHDICSAVHPLAIASPFFQTLPLHEHGLKWIHSEAEIAHPFDDGEVILVKRSVEATASALGKDQAAYQKLFAPLAAKFDLLIKEILAPPLHFPHHPGLFMNFGLKALTSASGFADSHFENTKTRAVFLANAAHSQSRLTAPTSSAVGLTMQIAAHHQGWPIPEGGAKRIGEALLSYFKTLGGEIVTGVEIQNVEDLPKSKWVFFDLTPKQVLLVAEPYLPVSVIKSFQKYRYGPGVFKMDWALRAPVPWKNKDCARSVTVHLGSESEIIQSEEDANQGIISNHPFILFSQPTLFDPSRAPEGYHTAWAYCHVPHASTHDMTQIIENQVERYAPGFKKTILSRHKMFPHDLEAGNPNLIGGDISGGMVDAKQLFFRPRVTLNPYRLDGKRFWICSSSTPPGPGVHGMSGYHAAHAALRSK